MTGATGATGITGATGATGPAGDCYPVGIDAVLTACDDVTAGDPYANFTNCKVYPEGSGVFTVNGDSICLNESGLYNVIANVCYKAAHGDCAEVALCLNGTEICCAKRRLNCNNCGVTVAHMLDAKAGDELAVAFRNTDCFDGLKVNLWIKHFVIEE